jgi:alkaline phosphatase D
VTDDLHIRRLLETMRRSRLSNPIVITGDLHVSWVAAGLDVPDAPAIGAEFVGTSVSSGGDGSELTPEGKIMLEQNPALRYHRGQRGYVRCTVTPERWTSDYRLVSHIMRPDAPIRTDASFVVESGRPGVERA